MTEVVEFQQMLTPEAAASLMGAYTQANAALEAARIQANASIYSGIFVLCAAIIAYAATRLQTRPHEIDRANSISAYRYHMMDVLSKAIAQAHLFHENAHEWMKLYKENQESITLKFNGIVDEIPELDAENRNQYGLLGPDVVSAIHDARKTLESAIEFQSNVKRDGNKLHEYSEFPSLIIDKENPDGSITFIQENVIEQYVSTFTKLRKELIHLHSILRNKSRYEYYGAFAQLHYMTEIFLRNRREKKRKP